MQHRLRLFLIGLAGIVVLEAVGYIAMFVWLSLVA
jgi:hypothetical protein